MSAHPRLLMVSHYFEDHRGGIEIVAGRLARELEATGSRVSWAATGSPPPIGLPLRSVALGAWNGTEHSLGIPFPVPSLGAIKRLVREVGKHDVVIVHDALYLTSICARLAAWLRRKPVMVVQHIAEVDYRNPFLKLLMRVANRLIAQPMLSSADQVVFISETTRRHFSGLRLRTPAVTIFNGVDDSIFRPVTDEGEKQAARNHFGLAGEAPVALFVGRFVEKKGLNRLRKMAELLPDVRWALAGWGPIDPTEWRIDNVRVFGGLAGAELAALYRAADIFVLPSTGEGFPLVVQEALASGLPVICGADSAEADREASSRLVGVPVAPDADEATAAAFAMEVARALANPGDARARHRFASDRYSWIAAARQYRSLLNALLVRDEPFERPAMDGEPCRE